MQAGRLTERVSIYKGENELKGLAGGVVRTAKPLAVAMANIKIDTGSYVDELGGYVATQDVTFEMHYHLRGKLMVGNVISRAMGNTSRVDEGGEVVGYELYEVTSVQPNRQLNRVYVKGQLLKVVKEELGI